jgi:hypothetical protein
VESENGPEGYVDFPALSDGRKISLCWKLGEAEVLFWHDLDDNCNQRQFLTVECIAGGMPGEGVEEQ